MISLVRNLEAIRTWHAERGRRAAIDLCKGATSAEISDAEGRMGLKLPSALKEVFAWHNGNCAKNASLGELSLFPGFRVLTLQEVVHDRPDVEVQRALGWRPEWIPFAGNGGGDFYVVSGAASGMEASGSDLVWMYTRGEPEHMTIYDSIESMFRTIAMCFHDGAFAIDEYGYIAADMRLELAVSSQLNPGSAWWPQLAEELE